MKSRRISSNQARYLAYIAANPGCSTADVNRACKLNPRAGHKWVYDSVKRLRRRGFLRLGPVAIPPRCGKAYGLYLTDGAK